MPFDLGQMQRDEQTTAIRGAGICPRLVQSAGGSETQSAPSITSAVNDQDELLGALQKEIAELEQRISAFVRPVPPSVAEQFVGNRPGGSTSALAEAISRNNARILGCIGMLQALTARVDAL
jgi:hypothetical protein